MLEELSIDQLLAADAESEGGETGTEEVPNPVLPTGNEIVWAAVFFFALWALMKYVLLPPINRTRAERAAKIAAAKDAVSGASSDVAEKQAAYDEAMAEARAAADDIIDEARVRAETNRVSVMAAAEAEVAELRASAAAELQSARSTALQSLRSEVAAVAVGAASSVVGRRIDAAGAQSRIDGVLDGGAS